MNYFNRKKEKVTGVGYSLNLAGLRNILLAIALVFGLFASCLTTTTIASAKQGQGRLATALDQNGGGAKTNAPVTSNVTYTKTGPTSLKNGGTATYNFKITNSDPIIHETVLIDIVPSNLAYTGPDNLTDGESYFCFAGELPGTDDPYTLYILQLLFPTLDPSTLTDTSEIFECFIFVQPNSTINFSADFVASGTTGECVTNYSALVVDTDIFTTAVGNAVGKTKSKEDVQKDLQAITSEPLAFDIKNSNWTSCFASETKTPADLVAQLRVTPDRTEVIDPNSDISYILSLKNQGSGDANRVAVTFPFDSNLDVGYLTSNDKDVWVSAVDTTSAQHTVTVSFPTIQPNATYSATLVMRPSTTAASGASEFNRFSVKWDDAEKQGKTQGSNGVRYSLSDVEGSTQNLNGGEVQLFDPATATVSNGQSQVLTGDFFAPGENVTAWYTAPDGTSTSLGSALAGPNGELSITISPVNLTAGDLYNVSAFGNRSGVYGSSVITIGSGS